MNNTQRVTKLLAILKTKRAEVKKLKEMKYHTPGNFMLNWKGNVYSVDFRNADMVTMKTSIVPLLLEIKNTNNFLEDSSLKTMKIGDFTVDEVLEDCKVFILKTELPKKEAELKELEAKILALSPDELKVDYMLDELEDELSDELIRADFTEIVKEVANMMSPSNDETEEEE